MTGEMASWVERRHSTMFVITSVARDLLLRVPHPSRPLLARGWAQDGDPGHSITPGPEITLALCHGD